MIDMLQRNTKILHRFSAISTSTWLLLQPLKNTK